MRITGVLLLLAPDLLEVADEAALTSSEEPIADDAGKPGFGDALEFLLPAALGRHVDRHHARNFVAVGGVVQVRLDEAQGFVANVAARAPRHPGKRLRLVSFSK